MREQIKNSNSKMNFKKKRELRFKNICSNFENEMLSSLICCSKVKADLFKSLSKNVNNYFIESKKHNFLNKTPNGLLVPKKEIEELYNKITIAYRDILLSLNFNKILSRWTIPVIRYKEALVNKENANRSMRSELPHSDTWVGWDTNSILINIPILGDTDHNRVNFFESPDDIDKTWIEKQDSFEVGAKKFANKCKILKSHYKKGYIYIADISVLHQTHRDNECKERVSMDIALYIDEPSKNDFGYNDTLSYEEIISIGSENKLIFPLKMDEIIGKSGVTRSNKFSLSRI